jgi:hypothetical protein
MPWAYGDDDFAGREGGDRSDRREESAGKGVEVFFFFSDADICIAYIELGGVRYCWALI